MQRTFEVGAYVWFIDPDNPRVMHYLVVEEIVKNSVSGTTREYMFESSNGKGKSTKVSSRSLKGSFFNERAEVYEFMLEQASTAINSMLDRAQRDKPKEVTPVAKDEQIINPKEIDPTVNTEESVIVELPDGTKARLKGGFPNET